MLSLIGGTLLEFLPQSKRMHSTHAACQNVICSGSNFQSPSPVTQHPEYIGVAEHLRQQTCGVRNPEDSAKVRKRDPSDRLSLSSPPWDGGMGHEGLPKDAERPDQFTVTWELWGMCMKVAHESWSPGANTGELAALVQTLSV